MVRINNNIIIVHQVKILAENKETLQLAMKEILQRLEGALCKISTSK